MASRLLKSELGLDLAGIQVYPTNQYTRSVHRLLQLTANLYDASTNRLFDAANGLAMPSVFQPLFSTRPLGPDTSGIFITGYQEVTNASYMLPPPLGIRTTRIHDLSDPGDREVATGDMVYGVPLIIGARKSLPNFNEFSMQTVVQVKRRLEFRRLYPQDKLPSITNQMFVVSISNQFGIEAWNSYSNAYPHDLSIMVAFDAKYQITNELGRALIRSAEGYFITNFANITNIARNTWHGFTDANHASVSFQIPLSGAFSVLSNSTYSQGAAQFIPLAGLFENYNPRFRVPRWWLNINPRLRFIIFDTTTQRIVDYVNLNSWEKTLDITDMLMRQNPQTPNDGGTNYLPAGSDWSMWYTNRWPRDGNENCPTYGILNQIGVSAGNISPQNWSSFIQISLPGLDRLAAIDFFRYQFGLSSLYNPGAGFFKSNTFYAPFVPVRSIYVYTTFQANDPLVHFTVDDLIDLSRLGTNVSFFPPKPLLQNLGRINDRYEPWGGNPYGGHPATALEFGVKDPLVRRSDDWNFLTNASLGPEWLGRVHRGTPWQTLYLKSRRVDLNTWALWVGTTNLVEAERTQPCSDWGLMNLLAPLFNTNSQFTLHPLNSNLLSDWLDAFNGIAVLTNTIPDEEFANNLFIVPTFDSLPIDAESTQAMTVADAIITAHSNSPNQRFSGVGDLLAIPELSDHSPWLNVSSSTQLYRGISDEAYEAMSSQLISNLRPDSIGSVDFDPSGPRVRFSGIDGYSYAIERSLDLKEWVSISTNIPIGGTFSCTDSWSSGSPVRWYRSVLLP